MDTRDRYLIRHHRRRLAVAGRFPAQRQWCDACRQQAIAAHHHRTQLYLLLALWKAELAQQLAQSAPPDRSPWEGLPS